MKIRTLLLGVASAFLLAACSGSNSNNRTTTSPTYQNTCVRNAQGYTTGNCNGGMMNGQCVMTAQGYYINQMTGQPCSNTGYNTGGYGGGYGGGYQDPCAYASQMYGVQYQYVN